MKKILLEYVNVIGYTITGLVFGFAFFLLFINFYHYQEINEKADVSKYNQTNKKLVIEKVDTIKKNINVYSQNKYKGNLNVYGLNNAKIKLQQCVEIIESDEVMKYLEKEEMELLDVYNFSRVMKNEVLNDCLVMQARTIFYTDSIEEFPDVQDIKPFVDISTKSLTDSVSFVQSNIENADHYYFSTNVNKINFFNLVEDSYYDLVNKYQITLDLLVEISSWYKDAVEGGE